jgi:hypothetical protein
MAEETKLTIMAEEAAVTAAVGDKSRRAFVKTAAQVAVTAPAVGLLLSATTKSASAQIITPYEATQRGILDDFTFGNTDEDIDGCKGFGLTEDDTLGGPGCTTTASTDD